MKETLLQRTLLILILLFLLGWSVGYFAFREAVGGLIHLLLILAAVGLVVRLYSRGHKDGEV